MKYILLFLIKIYWLIWPAKKRRQCIFKLSCSKFVYSETLSKGLGAGIRALQFRYNNCRHEYQIYKNPVTNEIEIILISGGILSNEEIADYIKY